MIMVNNTDDLILYSGSLRFFAKGCGNYFVNGTRGFFKNDKLSKLRIDIRPKSASLTMNE
jgi:hypothetical protein